VIAREVAEMGNLGRTTAVLGLAMAITALASLPAAAGPVQRSGRVGPQQYFTGVINGTDGNTATPITIEMACGGPGGPGRTGHPVSGQTLAVHQLFPPSSSSGSLGYTGDDSQIGVFFNAPPPASVRGAARVETKTFIRYDKPRPLSTRLRLPCTGTGTVYFSPIPVTPPSRAATVPVQFESQP
jgi:hypothetical protein